MRKKLMFSFLPAVMVSLFLTRICLAAVLMTKEEALKTGFGKDVQVVTETKNLTPEKVVVIKERLGGNFNFIPKGSSVKIEEKTKIDFLFGIKSGNKTGVAIVDEEIGKWGPMQFIIFMNTKGVVTSVEVLSHVEKKGQPVSRRSFLSRFEGKSGKDKLQIDKDINGISGATISASAAVFAVKKAIIIYEEYYLK